MTVHALRFFEKRVNKSLFFRPGERRSVLLLVSADYDFLHRRSVDHPVGNGVFEDGVQDQVRFLRGPVPSFVGKFPQELLKFERADRSDRSIFEPRKKIRSDRLLVKPIRRRLDIRLFHRFEPLANVVSEKNVASVLVLDLAGGEDLPQLSNEFFLRRFERSARSGDSFFVKLKPDLVPSVTSANVSLFPVILELFLEIFRH